MSDEDFKKMKQIIKDEVKPLHGELAVFKRELSEIRFSSMRLTTEVSKLGKDAARIDSNIEMLGEKVDALNADMLEIQNTTKAIWIRYL